ncbi:MULTISPECIES: hypothetical protein [Lactococcus]|uniref:Uncharacterized protein n=2 Tax=Lactococcus TaxID=1357 RepID=A0A387BFF4_9LACT|nr:MULTISPECIES: hypothetical protein [Lactococcus]AYG01328.1 hypothetical protein D7I46_09610 [Lactococcus allomyrinae]QDK70178.1 hypothetical protein FLP15_02015 [Lactococcus protaetiae]
MTKAKDKETTLYVIKSTIKFLEGYYTGESFIVQGSRYAVFSEVKSMAKAYSSRKRAENALESVLNWAENIYGEGLICVVELNNLT